MSSSLRLHPAHIQVGNFVWFEKAGHQCPGLIYEKYINKRMFDVMLLDTMELLKNLIYSPFLEDNISNHMRAYPREKAIIYVTEKARMIRYDKDEDLLRYINIASNFGLIDADDYIPKPPNPELR